MNRKEHWEKVYTTKTASEVSWYQPVPGESLQFIKELQIPKDAAIIDIGGGDSLLADHLLTLGYTDITVLDISAAAIERAKQRLGSAAGSVKWIVEDITAFKPERQYDCWHDRAAFHFLTGEEEVNRYLAIAGSAISPGGKIIIGTFSENGPEKCSGLPVQQYSETSLTARIKKWFEKIRCVQKEHITPFNTIQQFIFCSFKKRLT